ncbi:MAG: hypothetical protein IPO21_16640 [Bacteroidales bacterium]|nr:hypothetical protein [Bacteroidales bacterium]
MKIIIKARSLLLLVSVLCTLSQQIHAQLPDSKITTAEYFIDLDKGEGLNTALQVYDGKWDNAIETVLKNDISLTLGMHKIGIRVKDTLGWSPVFQTIVSVEDKKTIENQMQIAAGEYFFDTDPGLGKGVSLIAFKGNFDNALETAIKNITTLPSEGIHRLGMRVKDYSGNWSAPFYTVISIEGKMLVDNKRVTYGELFLNSDTASATPFLAFNGAFDQAIETLIQSNDKIAQTSGLQRLNIRIKDIAGNWSSVFSTVISIEEKMTARALKITAGEYFINDDPGAGAATPFLAFDFNFDAAFETIIKDGLKMEDAGLAVLSVRVADADGNWSSVFSTVISVESPIKTRQSNIVSGEIYWDIDPGEGMGSPIIAFDGDFDNAVELAAQSFNTAAIGTGHHTLACRVKDKTGKWSPVVKTVVFIDECLTKPIATVVAEDDKTSFCQGDSVKLTANTGSFKYRWVVGGTQLPDTTQSIYVAKSGYYKAVVIDGNGCPGASDALSINVIPLDTKIATSKNPVLCKGEAVVLSVTAGYTSYAWSTGSKGTYINVDTSGIYKVSVTNLNCTRTDSVEVIVNPLPNEPIIQELGPTTICQGDSVMLQTSAIFDSYLWSNGAKSKKVKIEKSGIYYVTVANTFNCQAVSSVPVSVSVLNSKPTVYSLGSAVLCDGDSVKLYTTGNFTEYLWNTGDTLPQIYAKSGGSYTLTVTYNECTGYSDAFEVTVNPDVAVPQISKSDTTTFCEGGSVKLTSSITENIAWNTGSTSASITVQSSGLYYVTTRNQYGCTASSSPVAVTVLSLTPTIVASKSLSLCQGDSLQLSVGKGYSSYLWSNGAKTESITVNKTDSYSVTVTNSLCGANEGISLPVKVTVNPAMTKPSITQEGALQMCSSETLLLTASPAAAYLWSNGAASQSISIVKAGTYFVRAYNEFGCSKISDSVDVNIYPQPIKPNVFADGKLSICTGDSVKLTTDAAADFVWNNGDKSASIYVKQSGEYYVIVSSADKCQAQSDKVQVTVTDVDAKITASGKTVFCEGDSVTLMLQSGYDSYAWSNGQTTNEVVIKTDDTYQATATKNGCEKITNPLEVTVWLNPTVPVISQSDTARFCQGDSVILSSSLNDSYRWSSKDTTQSIVVRKSGNYVVTVANDFGCSKVSSDFTVTVIPNPATPIATIMKGNTDFCVGDSVLLSSDNAYKYLWSTGDTVRQVWVKESGLYHVVVTNVDNCSSASEYTQIVKHNLPDANILALGSTVLCLGDSVVLYTQPAVKYEWSTNDTARNITIKTEGIYGVAITDQWGCVNSDTTTVIVHQLPDARLNIKDTVHFCAGDSVIVFPKFYETQTLQCIWNGKDSLTMLTVNKTGVYSALVSNEFGCKTKSDTLWAYSHDMPVADITSSSVTEFCKGDSVILSIPAAYKYS